MGRLWEAGKVPEDVSILRSLFYDSMDLRNSPGYKSLRISTLYVSRCILVGYSISSQFLPFLALPKRIPIFHGKFFIFRKKSGLFSSSHKKSSCCLIKWMNLFFKSKNRFVFSNQKKNHFSPSKTWQFLQNRKSSNAIFFSSQNLPNALNGSNFVCQSQQDKFLHWIIHCTLNSVFPACTLTFWLIRLLTAEKLEIWTTCEENASASTDFTYLGYIALSDNASTLYKSRELKSVVLPETEALSLKLRLHKPHNNAHNVHGQVNNNYPIKKKANLMKNQDDFESLNFHYFQRVIAK